MAMLLITLAHAPVEAAEKEKPKVTLILQNGDRLTGELLSEDAERVVLSTPWNVAIFVPKSSIQERHVETPPPPAPEAAPPTTPPPTVATTPPPTPPPAAKPSPKTVARQPSPWKFNIRLGANVIDGAKDQEAYFAHTTVTYALNYKDAPRKFFRNTLEYRVDYGETDGRRTANRMSGTLKMDADLKGSDFYGSLWGLVGYDEIRKIDAQYEIGPSLGYHILTLKNFVLNAEAGVNWQSQDLKDTPDRDLFQGRFRQDLTWNILPKVTLTERLDFLPLFEDLGEYQLRAEGNLGVGIVRSLSVNFTLLSLYDSQPAPNVPNNELQFRMSLGVTF